MAKKLPKKLAKSTRGGQKKEYVFLKTVHSMDELDNLRFKNSCSCVHKPVPNFNSHNMPCTRKYRGPEKCDFELLALRQESGTLHVYAHSQHNHPILPEEKRAMKQSAKELMPANNPPNILRTPDNMEWAFLQTFPDYAQMQEFRLKSKCRFIQGREKHLRFRLPCNLSGRSKNCKFQLLALKTTSAGYHVYTFGQHNHPVAIMPRSFAGFFGFFGCLLLGLVIPALLVGVILLKISY